MGGTRHRDVAPFVARGFVRLDSLVLAADRGDPIAAPHRNDACVIGPLSGRDAWAAWIELATRTRGDEHPEQAYRTFVTRRASTWRRLEARGQGRWFGAFDRSDGGLLAALGVFVEARPGTDGVRIGRFQHVVTHPDARRRGLAGLLVDAASRHAFDALDASRLLIVADEHDAARRVYVACGYRMVGQWHGLQRGGY